MAIFPWVSNDPTYFKQLLDEVFCDIRNNQGRGKCYQPTRRPRLITLTETLIIYDITKTESNNFFLLYFVLKKMTTNTPSQGAWIDTFIGNNASRPQPTD